MNIITIEQAREHCKTDAVDDEMLTIYANAAEAACAQLANRALFVDQAALEAAVAAVSPTMTAAFAAHKTALDAAASLDEFNREWAEDEANQTLMAARVRASHIIAGKVADDDIIAAILLTTGHFYRNREENGTTKFDEVPMGAARIMRWHRRVGTL